MVAAACDEGMLAHDDAKAFYDRFGARQDRQSFYEDRASADLIVYGAFDEARRVVEFGCGTWRLAERLLVHHLAADAAYVGHDVSTTMVDLATRRLARWRGRAAAYQTSGAIALEAADRSCDHFVAAYALDLLNVGDCRDLIAWGHRLLVPDGLLCLAGLTHGVTRVSRLVSRAWRASRRSIRNSRRLPPTGFARLLSGRAMAGQPPASHNQLCHLLRGRDRYSARRPERRISGLDVTFQQVIHSVPTEETDG